jgi:hypothetical protein
MLLSNWIEFVFVATYMDKACLLEFKMTITYPVINYKIVEKPERLGDDIMSMTDRPFISMVDGNDPLSIKPAIAYALLR